MTLPLCLLHALHPYLLPHPSLSRLPSPFPYPPYSLPSRFPYLPFSTPTLPTMPRFPTSPLSPPPLSLFLPLSVPLPLSYLSPFPYLSAFPYPLPLTFHPSPPPLPPLGCYRDGVPFPSFPLCQKPSHLSLPHSLLPTPSVPHSSLHLLPPPPPATSGILVFCLFCPPNVVILVSSLISLLHALVQFYASSSRSHSAVILPLLILPVLHLLLLSCRTPPFLSTRVISFIQTFISALTDFPYYCVAIYRRIIPLYFAILLT